MAYSQALLTRPPLVSKVASYSLLPLDLHVLSLPPAFNLSHDQTLQLKIVCVTSPQAMGYCSMNSVVILIFPKENEYRIT